jgi:menaquinone-specific isochorismate synthase
MINPMAFVQANADTILLAAGSLSSAGDPVRGPLVLAPHFSLDPGRGFWLRASHGKPIVLSPSDWRRRFPPVEASANRLCWSAPDERRFRHGFELLAPLLGDGTLRKGVPITVTRARLDEERAPVLFERLLSLVPDTPDGLIAYGIFLPGSPSNGSCEFMIGATPEVLFDMGDDGTVRTMAVAGTRRASGGTEALAGSLKDADEHQVVVDDLVERLAPLGLVTTSETCVRQYGELQHLFADVRLQPLVAPDFEEIVRRLHPTPALGVHPRGAAGNSWLSAIDPLGERRRFGAPFGIRSDSGSGRAVVAIRNVQYHAGCLEIWAGCGVVRASCYDEEWSEVLDKVDAVRNLWRV